MSLIGMLEQFKLASILQRIETYEKTGLLVIRQGGVWVELYFRSGRLMCIGPVRTNVTLADRLLQDGVIPSQAARETMLALGSVLPSETRIALTLMDLGYVGHEALRTWAAQKTTEVLRVLLTWTTGEVHFEEGVEPSPDRLLVALSVSSLLASIPSGPLPAQPQPTLMIKQTMPEKHPSVAPEADISQVPTLLNPAEFLFGREPETEDLLLDSDSTELLPATEKRRSLLTSANEVSSSPSPSDTNRSGSLDAASLFETAKDSGLATSSLQSPQPVSTPVPKRYVDTSYMRPEMVLMPADLSAYREKNPMVQLTPDQWRLLTRVDGQTSLQMACQELAMLPEMVCQVAGELIAESLIQLSLPSAPHMSELSPISREMFASSLSNGYVAPNYATAVTPPLSASLPSPDSVPSFSASLSFETESQWGNGGNGATFVPGRGWIASPQPLQPLQSTGSLGSGIYTIS